MARHWKGMMWFGGGSGVAFILAQMTNRHGLAIAVIVTSIVAFAIYMIGEGGLKEPFGDRQGKK